MGLDGVHPRVLRELAEELAKPLSIIYQQLWPTRRLEVSQCDAHLQEGQEGGSGELQACQPDLGAGEGHGADHPKCHHAYAGQLADQAQPAWVYERQVLLD